MHRVLSAGLALALFAVPAVDQAAAAPALRLHGGGFHGGGLHGGFHGGAMHGGFVGGHHRFAEGRFRDGYGGGRRFGGAAVGAGIAGLAAGALIGSAIAGSDYGYDDNYAADYGPAPVGDDSDAYCANRFRSYDPASGTYLGYDGARHPCP